MECEIINLWMAQDGYIIFLADYNQERDGLRRVLLLLRHHQHFALHLNKPKEPRNFSYHARMADTILAAQTGCTNVVQLILVIALLEVKMWPNQLF